MKKKINLLEDFRSVLHERVPSRSKLVKRISETLNIEKEPASRRLNGNVSFSVDEVGKLASELDISLDAIFAKDGMLQWTRYILEKPWSYTSLDPMAEMVEKYLDKYEEIGVHGSEFGFLFTTLPINLFIWYPTLSKFILFKWGYYYIGSDEFHNFESFQSPDRFRVIGERFKERKFNDGKIISIWDEALIGVLCREVQSFEAMHIIERKHVELIRNELHVMLTTLENSIRNEGNDPDSKLDHSFYITNIHMGVNSWYHISDKGSMSYLHSNFIRTSITEDRESCQTVQEWIRSLRKVSSLISGTGQKERRIFFEVQHQVVDMLLKNPQE